jgi:hypothetical protein
MAHVYAYMTNSTERRACMLASALNFYSKNRLLINSPSIVYV